MYPRKTPQKGEEYCPTPSIETNPARVTISWHGWVEVVFTSSPFKCRGKVAWITPDNGVEMPYPYDDLTMELYHNKHDMVRK